MDWSSYYPRFTKDAVEEAASATDKQHHKIVSQLDRKVEIADIGCGYGGLLFALAPKLPETLILGTLLPLLSS